MKKSEWAPGVLEQFRESYEFKQCKKADGSIYGIPDSSSCVMGKEYKPQEVKNAQEDLFASVDKMMKSLGDLDEFNKALAEFTRANYILQTDSPDLGKIPLQANSAGAATKILGNAVKALSGIGGTKLIQNLFQQNQRAPINPVIAKK